jgi:hypothetical protein
MTDPLEQRVRESLEQRADRAGGPPPAVPEGLHRRVRGRQAGVLLATLATVGALVAGSVIGLEQLDRSSPTLGGDAETTSTGTAGGVSITYPAGWYFEPLDAGILGGGSPYGPSPSPAREFVLLGGNVPLFALSNYKPSAHFTLLPEAQACTPTAALLEVQEEFGVRPGSGSGPETWPVRLTQSPDGLMPPGCSSALLATWRIGDSGASFRANAFLGADVSDADRQELVAAFQSMTFAPASDPSSYPGPTMSPGVVHPGRPGTNDRFHFPIHFRHPRRVDRVQLQASIHGRVVLDTAAQPPDVPVSALVRLPDYGLETRISQGGGFSFTRLFTYRPCTFIRLWVKVPGYGELRISYLPLFPAPDTLEPYVEVARGRHSHVATTGYDPHHTYCQMPPAARKG